MLCIASALISVTLVGSGAILLSFIKSVHIFSTEMVGAVTPTPLNHVPIRIKTVTGSQIRASAAQSSLPLPPLLEESTPLLKIEDPDGPLRPSMSPTPYTEQLHRRGKRKAHHGDAKEDEEELFGRYVAAVMKKLSNRSKSVAKMRIQQVLFECEVAEGSSR